MSLRFSFRQNKANMLTLDPEAAAKLPLATELTRATSLEKPSTHGSTVLARVRASGNDQPDQPAESTGRGAEQEGATKGLAPPPENGQQLLVHVSPRVS